jgi:cytochrome b
MRISAVTEPILPIRVWDAATRLFHWAIVVLLGVSWLSESQGWMTIHFVSGYSIIALLLFRLVWGFIGSQTSRFSQFLKSPVAALGHLARLHRREPDTEIGHNAAGGWMVLLMLLLLAVQAGTGLCANDDGATEGPLFNYVGKSQSDWLSRIHSINFTLIQIAVVLHVLAILVYALLKRHDLIRPMVTGQKYLPVGTPAPSLAKPWLALIVFAIAVAVVSTAVEVL